MIWRIGLGQLARATALLFALNTLSALGCECEGGGGARRELRKAKAVFAGEIVEVKAVERATYKITIKVQQHWKGVKEQFVTISSPAGLCGIPFAVNERWLVYAYGKELWTNICQRTKLLDHAEDDLRSLGKAKALKKTASTF